MPVKKVILIGPIIFIVCDYLSQMLKIFVLSKFLSYVCGFRPTALILSCRPA